jgi:hypothetical protein
MTAERQRRVARALCVAIVLMQVPVGVGLYRQSGWATGLWPLPDARMTYIFLASIVATTGTLLAWVAWRDELGALRAVAFNQLVATPAVGLYLLGVAVDRRDGRLALAGSAFVAFGAAWAVVGRWARHVPLRDSRPLPVLFRASFVLFGCVLIPVGIALVARRDVFPWTPTPENATVIGLVFLGAAALFTWIVVHPMWAYGEMAMASFLAYDLVLAVPYLDLLRNRHDTATVSSYYGGDPAYAAASGTGVNELSLAFYLAVLAVSAILAVSMYVWGYRTRPVAQPALGS